jgi:hypothetical protein
VAPVVLLNNKLADYVDSPFGALMINAERLHCRAVARAAN